MTIDYHPQPSRNYKNVQSDSWPAIDFSERCAQQPDDGPPNKRKEGKKKRCQFHFWQSLHTNHFPRCIVRVCRKGDDTRTLAIITQVKGYASWTNLGLGKSHTPLWPCEHTSPAGEIASKSKAKARPKDRSSLPLFSVLRGCGILAVRSALEGDVIITK